MLDGIKESMIDEATIWIQMHNISRLSSTLCGVMGSLRIRVFNSSVEGSVVDVYC